MFYNLFRGARPQQSQNKTKAARSESPSRSRFQPRLEALEERNLLSFAAPVGYNIGSQPDGFVPNAAPVNVVTGDFNGDGKVDMIVGHKADNTVNMLLGNGNGTFQPAVPYAIGEAIQGSVFAGDFNRDGKLDLFLPGDINTANHPIILPGRGDGTFLPRIDSSSFAVAGTYARGWAVGDFNGDDKLDVVATTPSLSADGGGVVVLLGNGDGTFQAGIANPPPLLHYSRWVTTGDFNGDGKLDLAVADGQGRGTTIGTAELTILLGNGNGTFRLGGHYASPGTAGADTLNPEDTFAADLNNDGKVDVIVSDYDQNIDVFLGNGDGTFQPAVGYTTGEYPRSVALADVNGDGKSDLVVNNLGIGPGGAEFQLEGAQPGSVAVLLGNGDGTYQNPIQYTPLPYYPGWTVVADFNGDRLPDLAVTQVSSGHAVEVLLNQPNTANQSPTVTAVSPASGSTSGGRVVTITGTNFTGTTAVNFGGVGATSFLVNSDTSITVTSPAEAAGTIDITVYNAGTSATGAADRFTFTVPVQPPAITGVSPANGPTSGGTSVTITGTNFTGATAVRFGGVGATSFTVNSATSLTATAPAEAANTVDITVTTPGGTSVASAADHFSYFVNNGTDTWTGLGTTGNWSEAANWSANAAPGAGTTVIFDGTSAKSALVDAGFAGTVAAVQINSGFIGTVSLGENLTVTGAFNESAGTYNANGYATAVTGLTTVGGGTYLAVTGAQTLTGGLTVSGGTFTGSSGTVTTSKVTLSSGTLNAPSGILNVTGGNFTATGGTFNADLGTVTYTGTATPTVSVGTGLVRFYNFQDALTGSYPTGLSITGTLTVVNTFTWKLGSGVLNGNIEAQGDVDDQNHGGTGNPYFTLDGTGNQTIADTSGGGGGCIRTLTINKSSGTVTLACSPTVFSTFTFIAGTVNTGSYAWKLGGQGPVSATAGLNLGNIEIDGANVTVGSASLQVGNITFTAGKGFTAPTGNLFVSGNWDNSVGATFTPNGGTVVFDGNGGTQWLTSGGRAFKNLSIATGATLELGADVILSGVFTNDGTFIPNGHRVN